MKDPARIAMYLRVIIGEVAEAKGALSAERDSEVWETLESVSTKLRDLADAIAAGE